MRQRARPSIPKRRRVFVGCEGESERGYVRFLGRLLEEQGRHVFLDAVVLQPGGGDPLALVELAVRRLRRGESKGGPYAAHWVFVDADKWGQSSNRDREAMALAAGEGLSLVWQDPCHEALLLRHVAGLGAQRPPTAAAALRSLRQNWPDYRKPMAAPRIARHLDAEAVRRASQVEPGLAAFLRDIGFV